MKYVKMILVSFIIGCSVSWCIVLLMQSQKAERMPQHGCDMSGLAYGLAIGFNLLLAVGSLPALLNARLKVGENIIFSAASFFLLPVTFVLYGMIGLDIAILWYCVPYLLVLCMLFMRYRKSLNHADHD